MQISSPLKTFLICLTPLWMGSGVFFGGHGLLCRNTALQQRHPLIWVKPDHIF